MANRVLLDNVKHAGLRVALRYAPEHGEGRNQTLVVPSEFEDVQREYSIFLRKDAEDKWVAVALLGFETGENLFLNDGRWEARYVPAVHRRGPFFLGLRNQEVAGETKRSLAVHIDLDDPRVGQGAGEPLFKEHGGTTTYLNHVTGALHCIHEGLSAAPGLYGMLQELGVIQPIELEAQLGDGKSYTLGGLFTVGMAAFQALTEAQLGRLHRAGYLAPTLFIRSSLPNMSRLIDLKKRKLAHA